MAKDFDLMEDSNRSANPSIHELSDPARRTWVRGGFAALASGLMTPWLTGCANPASMGAASATAPATAGPLLGFKAIPAVATDTLVVPPGYVAQALAAWGEPVGIAGNMPAWREDASNSSADQAVQMGMHHDGIHFYALDGAGAGSNYASARGLLADRRAHV